MEIKIFLLILILLLIIDIPMITVINAKMYQDQFLRINAGPMNLTMKTWISAIICYLLLVFALYYFSIKENNYFNATILGFIIYGVYNTTNLVSINEFGIKEAIIDTLWGTTLFTLLSYSVIKLKMYMN